MSMMAVMVALAPVPGVVFLYYTPTSKGQPRSKPRNYAAQVALQHRTGAFASPIDLNFCEGKGKTMADATTTPGTTTPKPKKSKKAAPAPKSNTAEAKSRFNAALEEAKAGAAALKAEAGERAGTYRDQAKGKRDALVTDAKDYSAQAKTKAGELATDGKKKAGELAVEGKKKTSEAMTSLAKLVSDTAPTIDDKLGAKYGDYARSASRSLETNAAKLDEKSLEEIGEDAREFVRKSPGTAVGIAAVAGFLLARLFRGRD